MATNAQLYGKIQPQGDITGRVLVGVLKKAWQVLAEDPATDNHVNRLALAYKMMKTPELVTASAWRLLLSNGDVQAAIDTDFASLDDATIDWMWAADTTGLYNALANMEVG